MRNIIKKILSESFLNEKAARRIRPIPTTPKKEEKPEEEYNKTGWIHSAYIDKDGKFKIIWKDDLRKLERKYEEINNLESSIRTLEQHIARARRDRGAPPGYIVHMSKVLNKHKAELERLKDEVESESIDTPITNYFDI